MTKDLSKVDWIEKSTGRPMKQIMLAVELEDIDLPTWYDDAEDLIEYYVEDGVEM